MRIYYVSLLIAAIILPTSTAHAAAREAGIVVASTGSVTATVNKTERALKRRSVIYSGDKIQTASDAKAQIRLNDGSLYSISENTELVVDDFNFEDKANGNDRNFLTLIKGGFVTITGKIGKKDPSAYKVNSSIATIGVRGTHYQVQITDELLIATWKGRTFVTNGAGTIELGEGQLYNYARVTNQQTKPVGLGVPPPELTPITPNLANENNTNSNRVGKRNDRIDATAAQSAAVEGTVTQHNDETVAQPTQDDDNATVSTQSWDTDKNNQRRTRRAQYDEALIVRKDESLMPYYQPDASVTNSTTSTLSTSVQSDARLNSTELASLNQIGVAVIKGDSKHTVYRGLSSSGSSGSPILTNSTAMYGDPNFQSQTFLDVIKRGTAPVGSSLGHSSTYDVSWGQWNSSSTYSSNIYSDATNTNASTNITNPVYWITVAPTTATRTGTLTYSNVSAFLGSGTNQSISSMNMSTALNFDTGQISSGQLSFNTHDSESWNVSFAGTINGASLNFSNVSGTVNSSEQVSGSMYGMLTGSSAQAIGGGFSLYSTTSNRNSSGVFLVESGSTTTSGGDMTSGGGMTGSMGGM